MREYIHGEMDPRETARLEFQAPFVASFALRGLHLGRGHRVLDLGSGVGAMTAQLAGCFPGIELFAVDVELSALRVAQVNHPIAVYIQADGARQPFRDETFDSVHSSWLLEHVPSPIAVLREIRRVLRAGGQCQFLEVDNSSLRTEPEYPEVLEVIDGLNRAQRDRGGAPFIGRRLWELLGEAGFSQLEIMPVHLRGDASNPVTFHGLTQIFADIFESVVQVLGPAMAPTIQAAAARLRALATEKGAIQYSPVLGRGVRKG
jgi:SAM-dependent methyltransferase